ncbi:MAG: hypothetical protein F6K11_21140 [Leptolyngbya sp. SIO3F4]|nr:hypothetical protein [Leptolyngbya sp. SIO3F4]
MSPSKLSKRVNLILLSGLSLLISCNSPASYAQVSGQGTSATPVDNPGPIFVFSGGLLFIVVCIVFVLFFNRAQGQQEDEKARFEFQRLSFAAVVLTGLGLIFLESMAMYYWAPPNSEAGKAIFEACKTVIPPIITLVLGYYFGKSDQVQSSQKRQTQVRESDEHEATENTEISLDKKD